MHGNNKYPAIKTIITKTLDCHIKIVQNQRLFDGDCWIQIGGLWVKTRCDITPLLFGAFWTF